jgi:hypothetical protein
MRCNGPINILNIKKGVYAPKETEVACLSKDNAIELLNTWEQLLKTRPEQIMITEENGGYKIFKVQ